MPYLGGRSGGRGLGVLLLGAQMMNIGVDNIPPVTLAAVVLQSAIFLQFGDLMKWFPNAGKVCLSVYHVLYRKEWRRLILAALYHSNDIHLYYNMASFLYKGRVLERKFKSVYFLYLLSVFTVLTSLTYLGLNVALERVLDDSSYDLVCAVGFSGVIFALKVLVSHYSPAGTQYILGFIPVPSKIAFWAELVIIQLITPHVSFTGHLAGILVGLLYIKGPLKPLMDSLIAPAPAYTYQRQSTGYRTGYTESNRGYSTGSTSQQEPRSNNYTAGLSEEEQVQRAREESLREEESRRNTNRLYPDLDDLRQRRQDRFQ